MSDILAYLQHFWKDVQTEDQITNAWGTRGPRLHSQVQPGDSMSVVTTGGPGAREEWRLLQKVVVERLSREPSSSHLYRIAGREGQFAVYVLTRQPDLTPLLNRLTFCSGRRIAATGQRIGQFLQSPRPLSDADAPLLRNHADALARWS
jgi:hypothetical protein